MPVSNSSFALNQANAILTQVGHTSPAAGANYTWQGFTTSRSAVHNFYCILTTDANAANRWLSLRVASGPDVNYLGITDSAMIASTSYLIVFAAGIAASEPNAGLARMVPITPDLFARSSDTFQLIVDNIQVGDQLSAISEWRKHLITF